MNNLTLGLAITLAQWWTAAPLYSSGGAVWYAPGVMEATCAYRGYDMEGYVDGVALMSPADLGKTVWIRSDGAWMGPFRVCDCGMRGQVYEMVVVRGEVVELGWRTAQSLGMGPFDGGWKKQVEVLIDPAGPIWWEPTDYVEWFEEMIQ